MGAQDQEARRLAFLALVRASNAALGIGAAAAQPSWYINASTGKDTQDGATAATPLRTWGEYVRRTGYEQNVDGISVDVFLSGGPFPVTDPIVKRIRTTNTPGSHYGIHGTQAVLLDTFIAGAFTASVPATNTRAQFTVLAGLTASMKGALVFFPDLNAWSVVTTVVGQTATCLDPIQVPQNTPLSPRVVVPANAHIQILHGTECQLVLEMLSPSQSHVGYPTGPSFYPGAVVVEKIAPRQTSGLFSRGDTFAAPIFQFCEFQDLDTQGPLIFRSCSIMQQQDSFVRGIFDATTGVSCNGCAWGGGEGAAFPVSCNLTGIELSEFNENAVNEFAGNVSYQILGGLSAIDGTFGIWVTGQGSVTFLDHHLEIAAGTLIFGVAASTYAIYLPYNVGVSYGVGTNIYAHGPVATNMLSIGHSAPNAWPAPPTVAGNFPGQSACTSWTQLQGAPFSGEAHDYTRQVWIAPF